MRILEQLKANKGTISSSLGKSMAIEVLSGDLEILKEAIDLTSYMLSNKNEKNVRAGAAKIVETVALKKPNLIAPYLEKLLPALTAHEPQTRWMIMRTMGLCAVLNEPVAEMALTHAKDYIRKKRAGELCLVSSADLYLGDYGAISRKNTEQVFATLLESTDNIVFNEHDWLLEAFTKIIPNLNEKEIDIVLSFAHKYKNHSKKATQKRVAILEEICDQASCGA